MSDTTSNSFGVIQRALDIFGTWEIPTQNFDVPDNVAVGNPANFIPFSNRVQGLLDGMVGGEFTVPVTGIYSISWIAHGAGGDNGTGKVRSSQIVRNDTVVNHGQAVDAAVQGTIFANFGATTTLVLAKDDTIVVGILQDSTAVYPINFLNAFLTIIKLAEI